LVAGYKRLISKALALCVTKAWFAKKQLSKGLFAVYLLYRYEEREAASMGSGCEMTSDGEE
jgi:hypothetical protein